MTKHGDRIGFLVELEPDLHRRLKTEAFLRERENGGRHPMTELARAALDKYLLNCEQQRAKGRRPL